MPYLLSASRASEKESAVIQIAVPYKWCIIILFVFRFQQFEYDGSGCGFICVYLGVAELLESVGLCISPNSGSSQTFFLQIYIFFITPFSLSFWDSGDMMLELFICPLSFVPQVSEVTHRFILFN